MRLLQHRHAPHGWSGQVGEMPDVVLEDSPHEHPRGGQTVLAPQQRDIDNHHAIEPQFLEDILAQRGPGAMQPANRRDQVVLDGGNADVRFPSFVGK